MMRDVKSMGGPVPKDWYEAVVLATCAAFGLKKSQLLSRRRGAVSLSRPRQLAITLCMEHARSTYSSVGRFFNRDHSSIMYTRKKIIAELDIYEDTVRDLRRVMSNLKAPLIKK